jgi:hypothetical protein
MHAQPTTYSQRFEDTQTKYLYTSHTTLRAPSPIATHAAAYATAHATAIASRTAAVYAAETATHPSPETATHLTPETSRVLAPVRTVPASAGRPVFIETARRYRDPLALGRIGVAGRRCAATGIGARRSRCLRINGGCGSAGSQGRVDSPGWEFCLSRRGSKRDQFASLIYGTKSPACCCPTLSASVTFHPSCRFASTQASMGVLTVKHMVWSSDVDEGVFMHSTLYIKLGKVGNTMLAHNI